jgi:hypothetical protein
LRLLLVQQSWGLFLLRSIQYKFSLESINFTITEEVDTPIVLVEKIQLDIVRGIDLTLSVSQYTNDFRTIISSNMTKPKINDTKHNFPMKN